MRRWAQIAAAVLLGGAVASVALACCGADRALDFMKYYAAIGTVGALGVFAASALAFKAVWRRPSLIALHLGLALVLGGWVFNEFAGPRDGYLQLRAGQAGRVAEEGAAASEGFVLELKDFTIDRWPDTGTVRQYTSTATMETTDEEGTTTTRPATISVNHPLVEKGWWVYQSSFEEMPNPHTGEPLFFTILLCVKDVGLPLATVGGVLLILGALLYGLGMLVKRRGERGGERAQARPPRGGRALFAAYGAVCAGVVAMLVHRGLSTGHPPLQNLYEFLMCAAAIIPICTFFEARGAAEKERLRTLLVDSLLQALVLIPVCFVMDGKVKHLMPALQSPFFVPHVGAYVIGYIFLVRAALGVGRSLVGIGFFLLTFGLVLGAAWGKVCWGHWWQFDPKEMWSLATWLAYAAYFHLRVRLSPRAQQGFLVAGAVMIVLTLTWINLSRIFTGMHSYA